MDGCLIGSREVDRLACEKRPNSFEGLGECPAKKSAGEDERDGVNGFPLRGESQEESKVLFKPRSGNAVLVGVPFARRRL